jgi:hypothetical protein
VETGALDQLVDRLDKIADALRLKSIHDPLMDDLGDLAEELEEIIEVLANEGL